MTNPFYLVFKRPKHSKAAVGTPATFILPSFINMMWEKGSSFKILLTKLLKIY